MEVVIYVVAGVLMIIGLLGCLLPILPGPPLNYAGLLLMQLLDPTPFTTRFMIIWGVIVVVALALDYFIPAWGIKRFGGSRWGVIGTIVGLIAGLLFFPPFGIIIGPIAGALAGELLSGRPHKEATRAAFGSFIGFLTTTFLKLTVSAVLTYFYFTVVF
jgi:uncharacterized protein YqgC (DUF456 family)